MRPIVLTDEQRSALGAVGGHSPLPIVDPLDNQVYYIVPAHMFEKLQQDAHAIGGIEAAYPLMDEVASREGWDDPEMDAYDRLDPRQHQ